MLLINNLTSYDLGVITTRTSPSPSSPIHSYSGVGNQSLPLPSHSCVVLALRQNSPTHSISLLESNSSDEVPLKDMLLNEINPIGNKSLHRTEIIDFLSTKRSLIMTLLRKESSEEVPTLFMNIYEAVTLENECSHFIKVMHSLNDDPLLSREINIER